MSYSFFVPTQWDDFENMFDRLVTDRYGPPADGSKGNNSKSLTTTGTCPVNRLLRPKMDVVETDDSFVMTTELPGAKKEDISVELNNGRLVVSGETKSSAEHSQGSVRVSERSFGSFTRTIAVPPTVTRDQIKAAFDDGVLKVTVPKVKPSKDSQTIKIA